MLSQNDLLDREQVAKLLGVSVRTIKVWHQTGILVGRKMGPKFIRYRLADVEAFALNLEAGTQTEPTSNEDEVVQ